MGRPRKGSCVEFRDAQNKVRFKIGLTPPPPLKGPQKWWTLPVDTQETKAHNTRDAWNEDSAKNPREYFPELFGQHDARALTDPTLTEYAARYFADRKTRNNVTDSKFVTNHVLPLLGDRPMRDIRIDEVRDVFGNGGALVRKGLSNKSVCNGYGLLRTMFGRAIRDDKERTDRANQKLGEGEKVARVMIDSPCMLRGDELPNKDVLGKRSRKPGAYRRDEVVALLTRREIPPDRRIFNALMLLTGMRHGEAAGLRWRTIDESSRPLWSINLETQYDGKPLKGKGASRQPA